MPHGACIHLPQSVPCTHGTPDRRRFTNAAAPVVFLVPLVVFVAGIFFRTRSLVVEAAVGLGWLFAVTWPATCIWVWQIPTMTL